MTKYSIVKSLTPPFSNSLQNVEIKEEIEVKSPFRLLFERDATVKESIYAIRITDVVDFYENL